MSVFPLGGNATHEIAAKTMKRIGIACLGEDIGNVVTRAVRGGRVGLL